MGKCRQAEIFAYSCISNNVENVSTPRYMESHFPALSTTEEFLELSSTEVDGLISRDTLNVINEEQVCKKESRNMLLNMLLQYHYHSNYYK